MLLSSFSMWPPTFWHWLALGLILLSIEMALGTFDLLWISIAAFLTSAFAAFAPAGLAGWEGQLIVFSASSALLYLAGRTVFRKWRELVPEHPTLNKRMASTVGASATVASDFSNGMGRVKLGDTEWSAVDLDGHDLRAGTSVTVEATEGNRLKVRRAPN